MKSLHLFRWKKISLFLPVFFLFLALVSGFSLTHLLEKVGNRYLYEQSDEVLKAMSAGIRNELGSGQAAVGAMAGSPWIFPALLSPNALNLDRANSVLDRYNSNLDFSVCYLLDFKGNAIAASNRNAPDSLVGQNYSFRPYFQEAIRGTPSIYLATGIKTKERGFYAAHPVKDPQGKIIGAIVIKKNVSSVVGILVSTPDAFFVSPEGVIFMSSSKEAVLKTLWPLEAKQIRAIQESKQFYITSFESILSQPLHDKDKLLYRGESYQFFQKAAGPPGWSLVLLLPLKSVFYFQLLGWIITGFMAGMILILAIWSFFHIRDRELLQESEEKYRGLFLNSSDAIMVVTPPSWKFIAANPATIKMFGAQSEEDFITHRPWDLSPERQPDGRASVEKSKAMIEVAMREGFYFFEWTHKRLNGQEFAATVLLSRVKIGEELALQATVRDITAQRQWEEALQKSEESLRGITDSAQDAILMMDPTGAISFWNPAAEKILGYKAQEAIGKKLSQLIVPERYRAAHIAALPEFFKTGKGAAIGQTLDLAAIRKDGVEISVSLSLSAIKRNDGWHAVAMMRDITERRKREMELRQFQRAIEQSPATVVITDLTGAIEYVNPKFIELTGYAREEALGKNPRILKSNEVPNKTYKELWETILSGKEWRGEFHNRKKNGELYWEFASISPIRDARGAITHFLAVKEDITDRKRSEEELKRQKKELELQSWGLQKANDGIKALYQELEGKNKQLEKLNRLKDDFVSIVAHELRNPLGVLREAAAIILDGLLGPVDVNQKKYIEIVRRTADRLIRITTDLLDLAKIEAGKILLNFGTVDLLALAQQASEGIALRAHKKGLMVLNDLPEGKLEIVADGDKILQVWINLLNNAFKFTEKGHITVEVKDLGKEVRCAVKDTGVGISKADLERLFSKFEQFGKSTGAEEKGSGLGLVISKSIVEAHGGRIWVESVPNEGTSFLFTLSKQQQPQPKRKLGEILLEKKVLTPEQLTKALNEQNQQSS